MLDFIISFFHGTNHAILALPPLLLAALIGAGAGGISGLGKKEEARKQREYEAQTARWSPWTHMTSHYVADPNMMGEMVGGAASGLSFGAANPGMFGGAGGGSFLGSSGGSSGASAGANVGGEIANGGDFMGTSGGSSGASNPSVSMAPYRGFSSEQENYDANGISFPYDLLNQRQKNTVNGNVIYPLNDYQKGQINTLGHEQYPSVYGPFASNKFSRYSNWS